MKNDRICPVCGRDGSRDIAACPSLARLKKGAAILNQPKLAVRPQAELEKLEAELASLKKEKRRLQDKARKDKKEIEEAGRLLETLREENRRAQNRVAELERRLSEANQAPKAPQALKGGATTGWVWAAVPDESLWYLIRDGLKRKEGARFPETVAVPARFGGQLVTKLGDFALHEQKEIRRVIVPEGIRELGKYSLCSNPRLEEISLPKSLRTIGEYACWNNPSLRAVNLPEGLVKVGDNAFSSCTNLREVKFPSTLKAIGRSGFWGCKALEKIELPDSLESLGKYCFQCCDSLQLVVFPRSWMNRKQEIREASIYCTVQFR